MSRIDGTSTDLFLRGTDIYPPGKLLFASFETSAWNEEWGSLQTLPLIQDFSNWNLESPIKML